MRIFAVELQNLRSYKQAKVEFVPGVNAILGQNGAGKSTILSAIGLALFNSRPPNSKTDELIREGASSAQVVVAFESAYDQRRYEVERQLGGSNRYRAYDPELGRAILAEGVADVETWLRLHLGVGAGVSLSDLFENTIGVFQGTFTAAFLLSPAPRKNVFDPLLRVDEYQRAVQELLEPLRLLRDEDQALAVRLATIAGQLEALPEQQAQAKALAQRLAVLERELSAGRHELEEMRERCAAFDQQRAAVTQAEQAHDRLAAEVGKREAIHATAQEALSRARQAHERVEAATEGHRHYLAAEQERVRQDQEREARDRQTALVARLAAEVSKREAVYATTEEALNSAREAGERAEAAFQGHERYLAAEQERAHLDREQQARDRQTALVARLAAEVSKREAVYETAKETLDSARKASERAEAAAEGHRRYLAAEQERACLDHEQQERDRLTALLASLSQQQAVIETREQELRRRLAELAQIASRAAVLEPLALRQAKLEKLLHDAEGNVLRLEQARSLSHDLRTRLERQQQMVVQRRTELGERDEGNQALAQAQEEVERLQAQLEEGQLRRGQLQAARQQLAEQVISLEGVSGGACPVCEAPLTPEHRDALLARNRQGMAELGERLTALERESRDIDQARTEARRCVAELNARLTDLGGEAQLREAERELAALMQAVEQANAHAADLGDPQQEVERLHAELAALDNPAQALATCRATLARRDEIDAAISTVRAERESLAAQREQVEREAAHHADLDERRAAVEETLVTSAAAHESFVSNRREADDMPRLDDWVRQLETELADFRTRLQKAEREAVRFADLDERRAAVEATLTANAADHECYVSNRREADEMPGLDGRLRQLADELAEFRARLQEAGAEAARYADLDERRAAVEEALAASAADHESYVSNRREAAEVAGFEERESQLSAELADCRERMQQAAQTLTDLSAQYDAAEDQAAQEQRERLQTVVAGLQARLSADEELLATTRQRVAQLEELRGVQAGLEAQRAGIAADVGAIEWTRSLLREAGPYVTRQLVRGISADAARQYNEIMDDYASQLQWSETYDLSLETKGVSRGFAQLSGGEQMAAALSVRLALARSLTDVDIAFFDEPTAHLDEERRDNLAHTLTQVQGFGQIFVISHDSTFEQTADAYFSVTKDDDGSHIERL